jgi:chemotaxis protein MotB
MTQPREFTFTENENYRRPSRNEKSWLLSYLDLMTLLLVLFVALISKATLDPLPPARNLSSTNFSATNRPSVLIVSHRDRLQEELLTSLEKRISGISKNIETKRLHKNFIITMPNVFLFSTGEVAIQKEGIDFLENITPTLKQLKGTITVEGHADSDPINNLRFRSNWELSSARAATVVNTLEKMGLPKEKLSAVGYGDSRPIGSNNSEYGKQKNRRATINIKLD